MQSLLCTLYLFRSLMPLFTDTSRVFRDCLAATYRACFNRDPDDGTLRRLTAEAGKDPARFEQVIRNLLVSDEFQSVHLQRRTTSGRALEAENFLFTIFSNPPQFHHYLLACALQFPQPVLVVGDNDAEDFELHVFNILKQNGYTVRLCSTARFQEEAASAGSVLYCHVPRSHEDWIDHFARIRKYGRSKYYGIWELVSRFAPFDYAFHRFNHYTKVSEMCRIFQGRSPNSSHFDVVATLNDYLPLEDLTILEYGPLDGAQTWSFLPFRPKHVTTVEVRPDNALKVLAAREALGTDKVTLLLQNFHNVNLATAGRFDLVYAHGVYYHSSYPFLFFENMISMSDNIFIGGWGATDCSPDRKMVRMMYEGERFRVKPYREHAWTTAGVEPDSYFFYFEDLVRFFESRGFRSTVIAREKTEQDSSLPAGEFFRVLFQR